MLEDREHWCIIDTETTGLNPKRSRVVELTVLSSYGDLILDTLIHPGIHIPSEVSTIHGISDEIVTGAPAMAEVWTELVRATKGKTLLAYNSSYDKAILDAEAEKCEVPPLESDWDCVMMKYSAFIGAWNARFGNYRYQKLPSAGHRSHIDCKVTLELIHQMSECEL